jgi:hypothetical protein
LLHKGQVAAGRHDAQPAMPQSPLLRDQDEKRSLVVDGHNLTLITTGLNSICLLTGFVVFTAVRRSLPFDRRLVLSGYRPASLITAKTSAALVQAVGAYAAIVLLFFWRPPGVWTIAVTFMLAAATYAVLRLRMPRPARMAAPARPLADGGS